MPPAAPHPNPDLISAFWAAVEHTSPTFVPDMLAAGQHGLSTAEFEAVAERLNVIDPNLLLVVGPGHGDGRPEIVISAGGIRAAFPVVRAVADAAPAAVHSRYDIRALRPRMPAPEDLRIRISGDRELTAADIRWSATPQRRNKSACDLTLYVPGWIDALPAESTANQRLAEPVFLLLDHMLGEWAVEMQIGEITWRSPRGGENQPTLVGLPDYLDRLAAT